MIREIQTTFVLTCGKVGMWEWNSRKPSRREHSFFMCYSECGSVRFIVISAFAYITINIYAPAFVICFVTIHICTMSPPYISFKIKVLHQRKSGRASTPALSEYSLYTNVNQADSI